MSSLPIPPLTPVEASFTAAAEELLERIAILEQEKQHLLDRAIAAEKETQTARQALMVAQEESKTDPLTGLPNRRAYDQFIPTVHDQAERYGILYSIVEIDIDRFKSFNDQYGHDGGDIVLKHLAGILNSMPQRPGDIITRMGGEEFAIILPGCGLKDGADYAERLRQKIESTPCNVKDQILDITCSIGAVAYSPGKTPADLYKQVDLALYQAKANGRNCVYYSTAEGNLMPWNREPNGAKARSNIGKPTDPALAA